MGLEKIAKDIHFDKMELLFNLNNGSNRDLVKAKMEKESNFYNYCLKHGQLQFYIDNWIPLFITELNF